MKKKAKASSELEIAAAEFALAIGRLRRKLRSEITPQVLNLSHHSTLARLEQRGWTTTAELARAESMKPQSMGDILKTLERKELVKRRDHPTDGRQIEFALTEAGLDIRRQRKLATRGWLFDVLSELPPEEQQQIIDVIPLIRKLGDDG